MSYGSDDLAPVLAASPPAAVGMRSGIVRAWNQETGENVIDVDGVLVENIAILNTSEARLLAPGDVVKILTTGAGAASWGIIGRFTIPGTPAAASALAAVFNQVKAAADNDIGTRNSSAFGDLAGASVGPAVTVNISQAGRALVFWSADIGKLDTYHRVVTGGVSVAVSGATTRAADETYSMGHYIDFPAAGFLGEALAAGGMQVAMMHLFTGLNPGSNTFTLKYRTRGADFGMGPVEFQAREIAVFAL